MEKPEGAKQIIQNSISRTRSYFKKAIINATPNSNTNCKKTQSVSKFISQTYEENSHICTKIQKLFTQEQNSQVEQDVILNQKKKSKSNPTENVSSSQDELILSKNSPVSTAPVKIVNSSLNPTSLDRPSGHNSECHLSTLKTKTSDIICERDTQEKEIVSVELSLKQLKSNLTRQPGQYSTLTSTLSKRPPATGNVKGKNYEKCEDVGDGHDRSVSPILCSQREKGFDQKQQQQQQRERSNGSGLSGHDACRRAVNLVSRATVSHINQSLTLANSVDINRKQGYDSDCTNSPSVSRDEKISEGEGRRGSRTVEGSCGSGRDEDCFRLQANHCNDLQPFYKGADGSQALQGSGHLSNKETSGETSERLPEEFETPILPLGFSSKEGQNKVDPGHRNPPGRKLSTSSLGLRRSGLATWTRAQTPLNSDPDLPVPSYEIVPVQHPPSFKNTNENNINDHDEELQDLRVKFRKRLSKIKVNVDRVVVDVDVESSISQSEPVTVSGAGSTVDIINTCKNPTPNPPSQKANIIKIHNISLTINPEKTSSPEKTDLYSQLVEKASIKQKIDTDNPMGSTEQLQPLLSKNQTPQTSPIINPAPSSEDGYDSDCLVIVECDPADCQLPLDESLGGESPDRDRFFGVNDNENDNHITLISAEDTDQALPPYYNDNDKTINYSNSCPSSTYNNKNKNEGGESTTQNWKPQGRFHNLSIPELKRKLAFCPICQVQHSNHKAANLCLSKHGRRQCWLCLEVMANTKDSYFQHCVRNHAVGTSSDIVGCPYCKKFFDFRQGFNQHIVKVHFSEDISYVSSTASLSPTSLVDLYTGQPRQKRRNSYNNNINNKNNINGCDDILFKNDIIKNEIISGKETPLEFYSTKGRRDRESESNKNNTVITTRQEGGAGGGGIVKLGSHHHRRHSSPFTRDSVIQVTPNLTTKSAFYPSYNHSLHQFPGGNHITFKANNNRPQSQPQPCQKISSLVAGRMASFSGGESSISVTLPQRPNSDPVVTTIISPSSTISESQSGQYNNLTQDPLTQLGQGERTHVPYFDGEGQQQFQPRDSSSYSSQAQAQDPQGNFLPISTTGEEQLCYTNTLTPAPVSTPAEPFAVASSPSLIEMQSMVRSSQVRMQYFNSVNSMLRTVAECCPVTTTDGGDNSLNQSMPLTLEDHQQQYQIMTDVIGTGGGNGGHTLYNIPAATSDAESGTFKVPNNVGIKRRILTKWDEHQERKLDTHNKQMNEVLLHGLKRQDNYSYYNHLRHSAQGMAGNPKHKPFWENIIKESRELYRNGSSPMELNSHQQQIMAYHHSHPTFRSIHPQYRQQQYGLYSNSNYQHRGGGGSGGLSNMCMTQQIQDGLTDPKSNQYPRIMARVDSNGRPTGLFTYDGQPCMLSNISNINTTHSQINDSSLSTIDNLLTEDNQLINNYSSQRQYQYKITPQVVTTTDSADFRYQPHPVHTTSNTSTTSYHQQNQQQSYTQQEQNLLNPTSRKRKSTTPTRVVQNSQFDSVVIQNPFEEEDYNISALGVGLPSQKRSHYQYSNNANVQQRTNNNNFNNNNKNQALAHWKALVRQQQRDQQMHLLQQQRFTITQGGKLLHCQPKFTAGGQITDYSQVRLQQGRNSSRCETITGACTMSNISSKSVYTSSNSNKLTEGNCQSQSQESHSQYQQGGVSQGQLTASQAQASASAGTWPFLVAPRYQEACASMLNKLKSLERQRRGEINRESVG